MEQEPLYQCVPRRARSAGPGAAVPTGREYGHERKRRHPGGEPAVPTHRGRPVSRTAIPPLPSSRSGTGGKRELRIAEPTAGHRARPRPADRVDGTGGLRYSLPPHRQWCAIGERRWTSA